MRPATFIRSRVFAVLALVAAASMPTSAQTPSAQVARYAIIANGENVGHVVTTTEGRRIAVDYVVDNNGRGPRLQHEIVLGADGLPQAWSVQGRSLFGGAVEESFARRDGRATWSSQADQGAADVAGPALYVANDDTPWSLELYANSLRRDGAVRVLPGGALRLEEIRSDRLGNLPVKIYRITGIDLAPRYFMLDANHRLAAEFAVGGQATIREGYEDQAVRLGQMYQELERERFVSMQQRFAHTFDAPVCVQNVRIFDPASGQVGPISTVIVYGEVISAIEEGAAGAAGAGAYVIDGEGGVLVPGLHDMHAHVNVASALMYVAAGVTSVRDQGNSNLNFLAMNSAIERGELGGPRIVRNGLIEGRSEFSARIGIVADTLDEALEAVRWYAAHGYWQIKIYNSLQPEWVAPVIAEARRLGLGVTGHIPAFVTPDQAIEAGYNDIAHINQLMLGWVLQPGEDTRTILRLTAMTRAATLDLNSRRVRRTIDLMRRNHVALDTTAVALETLMLSRARETPPSHAALLDHMPIGYQRYRRRTFAPITTPEEDAQYYAGFARLRETLLLLHRRGIQLLPGTDDGLGLTVQRELEIYVEAGIPAAETIALATLRTEQYLGRDQRLGSISRGKLADFFLVPRDPTQDISALREIRMTMRGGVAYLPAEIYSEIGIRPFAAPVSIRAPAEPERAQVDMPDLTQGAFSQGDH